MEKTFVCKIDGNARGIREGILDEQEKSVDEAKWFDANINILYKKGWQVMSRVLGESAVLWRDDGRLIKVTRLPGGLAKVEYLYYEDPVTGLKCSGPLDLGPQHVTAASDIYREIVERQRKTIELEHKMFKLSRWERIEYTENDREVRAVYQRDGTKILVKYILDPNNGLKAFTECLEL